MVRPKRQVIVKITTGGGRGRALLVKVAGDVADPPDADSLYEAISAEIRQGASAVEVDLSDVEILTSVGIGIEGVRRILELQNHAAALAARTEDLTAELEATRQALRRALAERRSDAPVNKLPVLRRPAPGQSLVVWRRQR